MDSRGTCPICLRVILLDEEGRIGTHSDKDPTVPCDGSGCYPAEDKRKSANLAEEE